MTEMESSRRGDELCRLMRERDDVIAQLSQADSQIETLSEQLQSLRREADSAAAELDAVGSDRDRRLVDLQTRLSAADDDVRQLQQTVAELKVERQVRRLCLFHGDGWMDGWDGRGIFAAKL
jgi:predicted RNase H-like nuclease (RuvC/YqgF family)